MTALSPHSTLPDEFSPIAERLEAIGNKFRTAHVLGAFGRFFALVIPVATAVLFLIGAARLSSWLNTTLGGLLALLIVLAYVRILHHPIFSRPTYGQIARWIEEQAKRKNLPLQNELINAVLLAAEYEQSSRDLAERTISARSSPWIPHVLREIAQTTAALDLSATVPWDRQRKTWLASLALIAASTFFIVLFYPAFAHGLAVLMNPNTFVPTVGRVKFISVEPGNDNVLAGQTVDFVAKVDSPNNKIVDAKIDIQFASGKHVAFPLTPFGSDNNQYKYQGLVAAENLDYIITAGDSQSDRYHIEVLPEIHLVGYRVVATPPGYTGKEKQTVALAGKDLTAAKGSLEVPFGSVVEITAVLDIPVKETLLDLAGQNPLALSSESDGKTFAITLPVKEALRFGIRINDGSNRTLRRFPDEPGIAANAGTLSYFTITPTPDQPPTIQVTEPARDIDAKPGDKVVLAAQATDDYGLTELRLETAHGPDANFAVAQRWPVKPGANGKPVTNSTIKHELDLPAAQWKFGQSLRYRFVAVDNRDLLAISSELGHQETPGQVFTITFNDSAAAAAKSSKLWDELRTKLSDLLARQVKFRDDANGLSLTPLVRGQQAAPTSAPPPTLDQLKKLAKAIGAGQTSLRTDMAALAKDFPFETSMKIIQKSLQVLVTEDATGAVDRAADILLLSDTKSLTPIATQLRQHQSRIIDVLQSLLAIATTEQKRENIAAKDGGDLPNEAKDAWKKLADDLKDFQKEQKQVINATADLAKKPKDQFDKNDQEKLAAAAALEDKWEKFLNERLVDMSKIAEQDQANVALLEELVQMKVELAMAKDALQTKATEVATPLEENGLEDAKSLSTHIERWLSQKPDRTNWQMEEPVTQNETPAAELPKQLQDMVGDLMDQEEDLTQDMESMGSKWSDSLDKGAGWDALDGPISNMSAQGVTGNQMPKDMEIQGRSGEGREGRASGEFVGAEAEGKGGRRTPTRMTPEPFSSGKVDDKSNSPAGGATGGGKKGGFGGEGLEGSAPDSPQDPMHRLQGKQAALRNDAERLQLQMHAQGFNNFKLLEAAVFMQKAEQAINGNQYHNALYFQTQAIQSLNTAKVLAAGQVHVTMDTTPSVNEKTQKDINDALNGAMPKGYADPVKAYFTKLSTEDAGNGPAK